MNDDSLRQALRDLPSPAASPRFTERLLARLDEPVRRPWLGRPLFLVPAAAALVAALALGFHTDRQSERHARLAELRREQLALAAELEAIKRQAEHGPLLYLGGDEGTDLVMDLQRLAARRPKAQEAGYRPASSPSL